MDNVHTLERKPPLITPPEDEPPPGKGDKGPKKMEGDEDQRRAAARAARESGLEPSEAGVTTGASKQPTHLRHQDSLTHEERLAERHRGKQQGPRPQPSTAGTQLRAAPSDDAAGGHDYDADHQRVFGALTEAEAAHGGDGVYVQDVADAAGLPVDRIHVLRATPTIASFPLPVLPTSRR